MGWPVRRGSLLEMLPPGTRLGPRWRPVSWQRHTTVGIDVGGGSLKVVQVSWSRRGARLETFAWVPLPEAAVADGVIQQVDGVARLLRLVGQALGLRQRQVVACVGGIGVMMRPITIPAIPIGELREVMRFEAPQALPIPEEHLVYDFAPLPDLPDMPADQMAVFVAGAHRSLVDSYVQTFAAARLRPTALDLECLTVLRALEATGRLRGLGQGALVLVDCGETSLGVTVVRHGVPALTRHMPGGFAELRAEVASVLGLSLDDAHQALWAEDLTPLGAIGAGVPWLRRSADGLARSLEFFLIQNRGTGLDRVFLYGSWAALPHMAAAMQVLLRELLGGVLPDPASLEVQVADLSGFPVAPDVAEGAATIGPALLPALGAALRGGAGP